jgi:hypothetical protein
MRIFQAGGSPIVETTLKNPSVICSAFVDVKKGKPNSRLKRLMKLRKKAKLKRRKK